MNKEIYAEYALVESQLKELENKKDSLRAAIMQDMIQNGAEKIETNLGKFTVTKLKRYEYPEYVVNAGEEYKAMKAKSEVTGEATYTEVESLRFTSLKL